MSNAFAPILRARPCPIFGRPVHPGSPPIDYSPILLLKPFGFRITPDTLSSSEISRWPARHYPRLWIQRPSSERRRDFNPPDLCAAQRTIRPCPTPARSTAKSGVEAATSDLDGSPPITRITIPTCRVHYPGGPDRCMCRLLPCRHGLPPSGVGSAFALTLSRPAQTSLALRPAGSLNRPRRPLSRGFDPASCPTKSLVSYRINRQLSGWNLPPQVIRAFGAHTKIRHAPLHRRPPRVRSHARPEEPRDASGS